MLDKVYGLLWPAPSPPADSQPAPAVPEPRAQPDQPQESPEPAAETGTPPPAAETGTPAPQPAESTDDGPVDLPTDAPVIGNARPVRGSSVAPSATIRVPDVTLDAFAAGRYRVAAVSIIGSAHVANGGGRQDAYAIGVDEAGHLRVAVADGLGSRPASQLGARTFCEALAHSVTTDQTAPEGLFADAAQRTAHVVSNTYGLDIRDADCVAVVGVFAGDRCMLARVGDCSVFGLRDGVFTELFTDADGYVNHVGTTVLGDSRPVLETSTVADVAVLAFVSDGLANDIRTSGALRAWLAERWARPATAWAVGDSLRYRRQGSHDDRTAVVVWTEPAAETPPETRTDAR
jgi:hypothetical protein